MQETVEQFDNPAHLAVTCPPEFTQSRLMPLIEVHSRLDAALSAVDDEEGGDVIVRNKLLCSLLIDVAHRSADVLLHSMATSHAAPVAIAARERSFVLRP